MSFLAKIKELNKPSFLESLTEKLEVLASRKSRYKEMLKPFYTNPGPERMDQPEFWDRLINQAITYLKRDDRIAWFIKKARGTRPAFRDQKPTDTLKSSEVDGLLNDLRHYVSNAEVNNDLEILDYPFRNQTKEDLLQDLKELTNKMQVKSRLLTQGDDKTFIKFPDGWEWHLLDRYMCLKEGKAMKHCGNKAHGKPGQVILSLREPVVVKKKKFWMPHATFILNPDGSVGEMKGYDNKKPAENLHPYIVELLKNEKIKQLKGGGHASDQNFKVKDLSEDLKTALVEKRPEFAPSAEADLDGLVGEINESIRMWTEYYESMDHLGSYDDFLFEHLRQLDGKYLIRTLKRHLDDDLVDAFFVLSFDVNEDLKDCCEVVEGDGNISLASYDSGEQESDLEDDLAERVKELSEEDFDEVQRRCDGYLTRRRNYVNCSFTVDARISLDLQEDPFKARVEELMEDEADRIAEELKDKLKEGSVVTGPESAGGDLGLWAEKDGEHEMIYGHGNGLDKDLPHDYAWDLLKIVREKLA